MALDVVQFICRTDNFGVLVHDAAAGLTVAIDAPEAAAVGAALARTGWRLTHVLVTHHHSDHVAGIAELKAAWGAEVIGPVLEAARIPGLDRAVGGGDRLDFGGHPVTVIDTPGHTLGHVSYHFAGEGLVFTGDTLFALGCGRIIEGDAPGMWRSLQRLAALPPATRVYCGHDYTAANARFALTVDPDNAALAARAAEVARLAGAGATALPSTIGQERATNPFLRAADPGIRHRLGMADAGDAEVFAELRARKDRFRG